MAYITGKAQHPLVKVLKVLVVLLLISGIAGGYLYFHPEVWKKWVKGTPLQAPPSVTRMYKWQDANGQWQVSDRQPPAGVEYEIMSYSSDENIVPSLPVEDK